MIHSYEGFERTLAGPELVPVLVVRVPVMSAEQKAGLRAEIASSILDGLLLLEDGLAYQVVDLPLPREWTPLLQEELEPEPPRPTGRNAAEKREILERLRRYRQKHGLGCFAALTKACGEGVTETTLRNLYHVFSKLVFCLVDTRCVQKYDLSLITGIHSLYLVSGCLWLV